MDIKLYHFFQSPPCISRYYCDSNGGNGDRSFPDFVSLDGEGGGIGEIELLQAQRENSIKDTRGKLGGYCVFFCGKWEIITRNKIVDSGKF